MSLRWYQTAAIQAIYSYYESGKRGNPLIGLPTGVGKSHVIAEFIRSALTQFPNQRILMAVHSKELISQNAEKMLHTWPTAPLGIYSAGLKQRDIAHPIIFAGIASIAKRIAEFGHRDILIVDEAHMISPNAETMYQKAIAGLREINPRLVVIGLSATLFRMGQGGLTQSGLFTDVIFDMTNVDGFNRLVAEGWICPLFPKRVRNEYDVSTVGMANGDFAVGELEKSVDKLELTERVLAELCHEAADREHWLIFASGVEHCEHINDLLNQRFGISSVAVHSKLAKGECNDNIAAFKRGSVRCAVNNNILTTGFDFPAIDCIGMLRPTMSPGLWVQMCGRGTRPSGNTGKRDCIVLDFAGNTRRLGPINDPVKPKTKSGKPGDAPVRVCGTCGTYCPASAKQCYCCGAMFTANGVALMQHASEAELIRSDAPIIETFKVARVLYGRHVSTRRADAKPCIRVSYICGLRQFNEWVHLDADGAAGHRGREWWRQRHSSEPPRPTNCAPYQTATDAALHCVSQLKEPKAIRVWVNRPNPEVQSVEY